MDHHTHYPSALPRNQPPPAPTLSGRPTAEPAPARVAPKARVYHADDRSNPPPNSHNHARWHDAKVAEVAYFRTLGAVTAVPATSVPAGRQIFPYTWRCTENPDRGNGKPPLRARFCMQGHLARDKDTNVLPTPAGTDDATPLADPTAYKSIAAGLLWVARIARPDRACDVSLLCNKPRPTHGDAVLINKVTEFVQDNPLSLQYPPLDDPTLRISAYADYSGSPQTPAHRHHQGHLIVLTDASHRFAPLH